MVETDTPYLSPPPYRQEANEPARVRLIGEALAEVWSIEVDEVARLSTATAGRVFGG
jgi:TatD DNase family protein